MILFITELLHYGLRRMERSNDRISHYCRIKIAQGEGKNWKEELLTYLFAYRTTPPSTLGISPAEALCGRKLRTKLPELRPSVPDDESIPDEDRLKKFKGKKYADDRRRATEAEICIGDPVSTGILPHSLPEWAFRARPGLWRICLCPKVARIAEQKFGSRYGKV